MAAQIFNVTLIRTTTGSDQLPHTYVFSLGTGSPGITSLHRIYEIRFGSESPLLALSCEPTWTVWGATCSSRDYSMAAKAFQIFCLRLGGTGLSSVIPMALGSIRCKIHTWSSSCKWGRLPVAIALSIRVDREAACRPHCRRTRVLIRWAIWFVFRYRLRFFSNFSNKNCCIPQTAPFSTQFLLGFILLSVSNSPIIPFISFCSPSIRDLAFISPMEQFNSYDAILFPSDGILPLGFPEQWCWLPSVSA